MEETMTQDGKEILFDIRHLTHTFETEDGKTFDALSDVTCTIPRGSFTAIIGTNGSGKSTLARHLNALYLPTAGEVIVEGMKTSDMEHIWDIRQKVGMVFQNPDNQLVAAIVEEDVAFGPENLGVPAEEIRLPHAFTGDALRRTEAEDRHRRCTRDASGLHRPGRTDGDARPSGTQGSHGYHP